MDTAAGLALIRPMLPQNSVHLALTAPCLHASYSAHWRRRVRLRSFPLPPPQETETAEYFSDDRYPNDHHRQHDTSSVPWSSPVSKITDDESAIEEMLKRDWELYQDSNRDA